MKFSKYISKAVTPVMALFQKQHSCLSHKATTICGQPAESLRQVPVRHNRGGKSTENKMRFAPPTMCRLTAILSVNSVTIITGIQNLKQLMNNLYNRFFIWLIVNINFIYFFRIFITFRILFTVSSVRLSKSTYFSSRHFLIRSKASFSTLLGHATLIL